MRVAEDDIRMAQARAAMVEEQIAARGLQDARVLEVGCGSGYMAAVLSLLAREVCALEVEPELCEGARGLLAGLGLPNIDLRKGDGRLGWPEGGAFDAIVLSCAAPTVPAALWGQVREGGRLLAPLGPPGGVQTLARITRTSQGSQREDLLAVSFVPLR